MLKVIIHCPTPEYLVTACRAAKWLGGQPETQKDAILAYGNNDIYYVKRNKASITVRSIK